MKTLLGWFRDPIVHLILVVIVVIQFAGALQSRDAQTKNANLTFCADCNHRHNPYDECETSPVEQASTSRTTAQR